MNLYKRLKEVGFDISVTRPCYRENRFAKDKDMYMGWYMRRIQNNNYSQKVNRLTVSPIQ